VSHQDKGARVVAEYWSTDRSRGVQGWVQHPVARRFIHRRVSNGSPWGKHWIKEQFFPEPVDMSLSLGCGFGHFERAALDVGISRRFDAFDLSPGAIEGARKAASEHGLTDKLNYEVADLNRFVLPVNKYDAIFAVSCVHHLFELERFFVQCHTALKPDGIFFMDEYIGPSLFQSPPFAVDVINRIRAQLPDRYRVNLYTKDGKLLDEYRAPTPEQMFEIDPSEAIRSAEILPLLRSYFDIIAFRPYGGAIQHMLFSGIMGNFDESDDRDATMLNLIATFEEILEDSGLIESEFAAVVAKPKARIEHGASTSQPNEPTTRVLMKLAKRAIATAKAPAGRLRRALRRRCLWRATTLSRPSQSPQGAISSPVGHGREERC